MLLTAGHESGARLVAEHRARREHRQPDSFLIKDDRSFHRPWVTVKLHQTWTFQIGTSEDRARRPCRSSAALPLFSGIGIAISPDVPSRLRGDPGSCARSGRNGNVAILQSPRGRLAGFSSWSLRFAGYSNGVNSSRRSSSWQWDGICVG